MLQGYRSNNDYKHAYYTSTSNNQPPHSTLTHSLTHSLTHLLTHSTLTATTTQKLIDYFTTVNSLFHSIHTMQRKHSSHYFTTLHYLYTTLLFTPSILPRTQTLYFSLTPSLPHSLNYSPRSWYSRCRPRPRRTHSPATPCCYHCSSLTSSLSYWSQIVVTISLTHSLTHSLAVSHAPFSWVNSGVFSLKKFYYFVLPPRPETLTNRLKRLSVSPPQYFSYFYIMPASVR